jgi:hypothetical protein
VAVLAVGEHHAGEEGAEAGGQADRLGERRGAEHEQQREADEHLAQARLGDVAQRRANQDPADRDQRDDQAERPRRVDPAEGLRFAAEEADHQHERDDGEVLEQQHRERRLAAGRRQEVLLAERGEADRGRGHGEAHAGDEPDGHRLTEQDRDSGHGHDRDGHLRRPEAEDRAAQRPDARGVELEADEEEQEHDADRAEAEHRLRIGDQAQAPGADRDAGDEVAEHGTQSEPLENRHRDDPRGEIDECLLEEAVGIHS